MWDNSMYNLMNYDLDYYISVWLQLLSSSVVFLLYTDFLWSKIYTVAYFAMYVQLGFRIV